jgi:hypothetical protein
MEFPVEVGWKATVICVTSAFVSRNKSVPGFGISMHGMYRKSSQHSRLNLDLHVYVLRMLSSLFSWIFRLKEKGLRSFELQVPLVLCRDRRLVERKSMQRAYRGKCLALKLKLFKISLLTKQLNECLRAVCNIAGHKMSPIEQLSSKS